MALLKRKKKTTSSSRNNSVGKLVSEDMIKSPLFWILLVAGFAIYFFFLRDTKEEKKQASIDQTTTCITSIREINEWEFLTIELEEMVDTTIQKTLVNTQIAKIYRGTAHLGFNTKKANKNWIVCKGENVQITLPSIELLDKEIIDDTQTRTFVEEGKVSATVKEKMFQTAKRKMKASVLQKENIKIAEENAKATFKSMFAALGYNKITVTIKK